MKSPSIAFFAVGISCLVVCGNNASKEASSNDTITTVDHTMVNDTSWAAIAINNSVTATVTLDTMDQNFALKATSGSIVEIEMDNMSIQNSTNDRVKAFASMMICDHGKASEELKA